MTDAHAVSPHAGHKARLRERFARAPQALPDYELLEMLLSCAVVRKDTKPLAKALLARFGSLRGVLDAHPEELRQMRGFGAGLDNLFRLLHEVMARYVSSPPRQRIRMTSPATVARIARVQLASCPHEECWAALLDSQNGLLGWERIGTGNAAHVPMTPRDALEVVLRSKATGFILAHNHPGGNAAPSAPDLELTQLLHKLCAGVGIRFLDHVIVTPSACYSLAAGGLIDDTGEL